MSEETTPEGGTPADSGAAPETTVSTPEGGAPPQESAPWYQGAPDDWREQIAGDDEAKLNQLKRVTDPGSLFKNYFEAQETIRTKQEALSTNTIPGEDATPEEWAAYRDANGIPAEAAGYAETLNPGLELGEEDKQALQPFFEQMHASNIPAEAAGGLIDIYYDLQSQEVEERQRQDSVDAAKATQLMKENWGGDFEANKNLIVSMFQGHLPADVVDDFMGARLANGTALFNHPGAMQAFADMARVINPAATIVPPGDNPMQTITQRIAELEGKMGEPGWHKDTAAQSEYQQLVDARDTMNARQQAG